jgi:hypothetical protein
MVSKEWLLHCYAKALGHDLRKVIRRNIANNLCLVILEGEIDQTQFGAREAQPECG